ncbi:MAG TPA: diacylglycerol kinase family protein [Bacteroidales bacterium]|jgi:YegS/Rv2252/BmrU family lipid kinase|nr:diacylglycerol kinase family protein [Bacteroidales bacterium]
MNRRKILFVINRKSGSSDNTDIENTLAKGLESSLIRYEFHFLTGDDDSRHIKELIKSFKPDIVCAAGGDGTINLVASIIMNRPLTLGIIPIGSANGLAVELGIPENPEEAINLLLSGSARPMDVVQINADHICLHLSDVGINARIVSEFEKEGKRGFVGYFKHFFRELTRPQKSFKCEILINNRLYIHRSYMTVIANASKYRTGANLNPEGKIDDGIFEIVIFKPYHRWIWRSLFGAFTGTMHKQPNVETYECTAAQITIKPAQDLQVDGESLGITSFFKANIHKHALNIILPSL